MLRYQKAKPLHVEAFCQKWLEIKKPNIAFKTWTGYRAYINNWIIPGIGKEYLPDLTHEKIQIWLNKINRSFKYKKNVYACLRGILTDAKRSGYIAQLPEQVNFDLPVKKIEWLDRDTQNAILENIPKEHRYIFRFLFLTGLRPSEARALRKKDIKGDHIIVAKTFAPVKGGEELKVVKNKREQAIPLYNTVRNLLDEIPKNLSPFIFINPDTGKPYTKNINRDYWNPACIKTIGYKFPLNNAGRHSFANQMLESGVDIETVSTLLRHHDTSITKANYARPKLKVMGSIVDRIQQTDCKQKANSEKSAL